MICYLIQSKSNSQVFKTENSGFFCFQTFENFCQEGKCIAKIHWHHSYSIPWHQLGPFIWLQTLKTKFLQTKLCLKLVRVLASQIGLRKWVSLCPTSKILKSLFSKVCSYWMDLKEIQKMFCQNV